MRNTIAWESTRATCAFGMSSPANGCGRFGALPAPFGACCSPAMAGTFWQSPMAFTSILETSALIWDVERMVNRPLPAVEKPSKEDLIRWWTDLRDANPGVAYKAVWRFAAVQEQTLPCLADSLRPIKPLEANAVARMIADLESDQFPVRQKASRELERLGETVKEALRKERQRSISLEKATRIDRLLAKPPGPEQWRATRALAVLEQIGGSQARKILAGLAAGAAEASLTQEAKRAKRSVPPASGDRRMNQRDDAAGPVQLILGSTAGATVAASAAVDSVAVAGAAAGSSGSAETATASAAGLDEIAAQGIGV